MDGGPAPDIGEISFLTGFSSEMRSGKEEGVGSRLGGKGRGGNFPADYNFICKTEEEMIAVSLVRRKARTLPRVDLQKEPFPQLGLKAGSLCVSSTGRKIP